MSETFAEIMLRSDNKKDSMPFVQRSIPTETLQLLSETIRIPVEQPAPAPKPVMAGAIFPRTLKQEKIMYLRPAHVVPNKLDT